MSSFPLSEDPNPRPAMPSPDECDAFVVVRGTIRRGDERFNAGDEIEREWVADRWENDGFRKYVPVNIKEDEDGLPTVTAHAPPGGYAPPTSELNARYFISKESRHAQNVLDAVERYEEKLRDEAQEDA